jgi:hypothetical protein
MKSIDKATLDLNLITSAMKKLLPTLRLVQRTVFPLSILFLTSFRKGGSFQHPENFLGGDQGKELSPKCSSYKSLRSLM